MRPGSAVDSGAASCFEASMKGLLAGILACTLVHGFYSSGDDVEELTEDNFNREVLQNGGHWLVWFYAPSLRSEWVAAAAHVKEQTQVKVRFGVVDAIKYKKLASRYTSIRFPTIELFQNGMQVHLLDSLTTHSEIVASALKLFYQPELLQGGDVFELTDVNFDGLVLESKSPWLVVFNEASCIPCLVQQSELAAAAPQVKKQTQGKVLFGAVDATKNKKLASRYTISFPTIKLFLNGRSVPLPVRPFKYPGKLMTHKEIVALALEPFKPELLQILKGDILENACMHYHWCIISVLPSIQKMAELKKGAYLDLEEASGNYMAFVPEEDRKGVRWLVMVAGTQMVVEDALGIGKSYPAMAAIDVFNMEVDLHKGPFSVADINKFLSEGSGDIKRKWVFPETWNGKDGEGERPDWLAHAVEGMLKGH